MSQLSDLLQRLHDGDRAARDALFEAAYGELHRLARARLRDGGRQACLDTTSLVHECYLRFVGAGELKAADRQAFFGYASQVMRSVAEMRLADRVASPATADTFARMAAGISAGTIGARRN